MILCHLSLRALKELNGMGETRFPGVRCSGYEADDSWIDDTSALRISKCQSYKVMFFTELFK